MSAFDSSIDNLEGRQEAAIVALLTKPTIAQAARAAKVGEATLFRWLQEPTFQSAYRAARREVIEQAIANVQRATGDAVDVLTTVMKDTTNPPSTRVRAAVAVLDIAFKTIEQEDMERRIAELEMKLGGAANGFN